MVMMETCTTTEVKNKDISFLTKLHSRYYSAIMGNSTVLLIDKALKGTATSEGTRAGHLNVHTILTYGLREFKTSNEYISKATIDNIYSKIKALILEIPEERIK
jgi:hypothetical protein